VCVQWSYDQGLVVVLETTDCPQTNAISTEFVMPLGLEAKKNWGASDPQSSSHFGLDAMEKVNRNCKCPTFSGCNSKRIRCISSECITTWNLEKGSSSATLVRMWWV
jgi:hypothetical protein